MRLVERCDTGYRPRSYYRKGQQGVGFRMAKALVEGTIGRRIYLSGKNLTLLQVAQPDVMLFSECDVSRDTEVRTAVKAVMKRWRCSRTSGSLTLRNDRERPLRGVTMDEREHPWRILLVDDEEAITAQLAPFLERASFTVEVAGDGEEALRHLADFAPDLIVLDVLMPRLDGRETLRRLRQAGDWTPVILLTQVGSPGERAMALDEGADDYLNKPFEPYELVARIRAVLRRAQRGGQSLAGARRLRSGPLELDRQARRATVAGREIFLTAKAFSVLEYLMLHPDEVLSRERLLDAVWGWDYPAATRAVDTRIAELRRALNDDAESPQFIETVIGEGYRFVGRVEVGR